MITFMYWIGIFLVPIAFGARRVSWFNLRYDPTDRIWLGMLGWAIIGNWIGVCILVSTLIADVLT